MCAGQESKREVRDRRSVGWDWRVAAVPGAEWRVPLWNTAGFEPRRGARLRRTTSLPPPPRSLLFVHLRFPPSLSLSLSSPTTMLPQEHRRGPATPLLLLPRILCRFYADNSDDDDVPISLRRALPAHCSSSKAIGKMDGRKKARAESRDGEGETVFILFSGWCIKKMLFCYVFLLLRIFWIQLWSV